MRHFKFYVRYVWALMMAVTVMPDIKCWEGSTPGCRGVCGGNSQQAQLCSVVRALSESTLQVAAALEVCIKQGLAAGEDAAYGAMVGAAIFFCR